MPNKDKLWIYFRWLLFLVALQSFKAWFFWRFTELTVFIITTMICGILTIEGPKRTNGKCVWWFVIYAISYLMLSLSSGIPNFNGFLGIIFKLYPIGFIFLLKPAYKRDLLLVFRKGLASLLFISLLGWILYLIGLPLPHNTIYYGALLDRGYQYRFDNYFVFLRSSDYFSQMRFQSVFVEPGFLGCMLSLLLYNGKYDLKNRQNIIFLVSVILSFSLAGILVSALGFILLKLTDNKRRLLWVILVFVGYTSLNFFATNYNGGDNILNNYIFERLQADEEKIIAGNNRMSSQTSEFFWNTFIKSDALLLGNVHAEDYSSAYHLEDEVSGYTYIMKYGLIAFLFFSWYYFFPVINNRKQTFQYLSLSLMAFLIFAQTIHMAHSFMYISLLVLCTNDIDLNVQVSVKKQ